MHLTSFANIGRLVFPAIGLIFLAAAIAGQRATAQGNLPNVVLILADDLGYGDIGAYGATDIFTPNIDQLASEGVRFTRFYAAPSCTLSRAMLMTGSYFPRVSMSRNFTPSAAAGIHEDEVTLGDIFKSAGYATGAFGKWHLGDHHQFMPRRHGFDEFYGIPYSNNMWPFHPRTAVSVGEDPRLTAARNRAQITGYAGSGSSFPVGEGYPNLPLYDDDTIVEFNSDQADFGLDFFNEAIDFIERHQAGPFFVYIPLSAPHVPLHPSGAFIATSGRDLYGDTVQEMDAGVGLILAKLTELGIDSETLVIFLSDNGPWLEYGIDGGSAGALRGGKEGQFEGGIRVPALMRWPGQLAASRVIDEPVQLADILPTLAGLAGTVPPAAGIDGMDLWDLLTGVASNVPRQAIFSFDEKNFSDIDLGAVISGSWKLHVNTNGSSVSATALYNLLNDPGETNDVKGGNAGVVSSLVAMGQGIVADIAASQRPLGVVTRSGEPFSEKSGVGDLIAIEAENYHLREARGGQNWQPVSPSHSSFERAMQALPNSGNTRGTNYETTSPHLVYRIVPERAARYYVWIRARAASTSDDSLHIGLDGSPLESGRELTNIAATWSWTSTRGNGERAYVEIAGNNEYELDIWMREDGVVVDKILLTTDASFRPYGKGPVESLQSYVGFALPPVAVDDGPYSVAEGDSISGNPNVLTNDIDPRSDPRTASLVSPPVFATSFELRPDGTFLYQHDGSESATDFFVYTARDVDGVSNEATARIAVANTNDAPEIRLLGANPFNLTVGGMFVDPGASADDEEDGDISSDIVVGGDTVNTGVVGDYVLTYDVVDSNGAAAAQVSRTVRISAAPPPPPPPQTKSGGGGSYSGVEMLVLGLLVFGKCLRRRNPSGCCLSSANCDPADQCRRGV